MRQDIDMVRFKVLINKWRDPKNTGDINKLNRLAGETIQAVNSEPLIKDICEIFLYAISAEAMNDPSFRNTQGRFPAGVDKQWKKAPT